MNTPPLTFFCDDCGNLKLVEDKVEGTQLCVRCYNIKMERNLRRMRSPSLEELRRKKRVNFHDD